MSWNNQADSSLQEPKIKNNHCRVIGNQVPQYVHHIGTVQTGTSFLCYLLLFWYHLITVFWTTEETEISV